jgi:hypothetical protein
MGDDVAGPPRYCRKCSVAFLGSVCPGGHPNFYYSRQIPPGVSVPAQPGDESDEGVTEPTWKVRQRAAAARKKEVAAAKQRQQQRQPEPAEPAHDAPRHQGGGDTGGEGEAAHTAGLLGRKARRRSLEALDGQLDGKKQSLQLEAETAQGLLGGVSEAAAPAVSTHPRKPSLPAAATAAQAQTHTMGGISGRKVQEQVAVEPEAAHSGKQNGHPVN